MIATLFLLALVTAQDCTIKTEEWQPITGNAPTAAKPAAPSPANIGRPQQPAPASVLPQPIHSPLKPNTATSSIEWEEVRLWGQYALNIDLGDDLKQEKYDR